jgi:hypothetical protein
MGQMAGSSLETPVLAQRWGEFRWQMALPAPDWAVLLDFSSISPGILTLGF